MNQFIFAMGKKQQPQLQINFCLKTGFGRNEKEANVNCIRNLIQLLLGDDRTTKIFRDCLKKMNEEQQFDKKETNIQEIPLLTQGQLSQQQMNQSSKNGSISNTPYQNNPNSFHISNMDFRTSYENFYSDAKSNLHHHTSVGNNNSTTTPSNLTGQNQQNHSSFSKYYSDALNANSINQQAQLLSIKKNLSQPQSEDNQTQLQQQNIFTSQTEDYCTNTMGSISGNPVQQLNASINILTSSQTNIHNNLQHSAPKEKPFIQQIVNTSIDGCVNSTSNKNSIQLKSSYEDATFKIGQAPLPQHRHTRNKSVNIGNYQNTQSSINSQNTGDYINMITNNNYVNKSMDKDLKIASMEEDLKKSKQYIEQLERKVKLVVEENKILKSLLLENKKSSGNKVQSNLNMSIMNTTNTSMNNLNITYNQQSNLKQITQTMPTNENLPPAQPTFQNLTSIQNKQPYFIPSGAIAGNTGSNIVGLNNNTLNSQSINISNNYITASHNLSTSMKDQIPYLDNSNKKNANMSIIDQQFTQSLNQNNILKDYNNKANILTSSINESLKNKLMPINNHMTNEDSFSKITNEKYRSLSVDINGKRPTLVTDNSNKKLDTSLIETGQCNSKIMGHKKYKSKIPKLNLEILPNYHGNSNKSINNQLLQQYQTTQLKLVSKIQEKQK